MRTSSLIVLAATVVLAALGQPQMVIQRALRFEHLRNDGNAYLDADLDTEIFHNQGQYSARYTVSSELPDDLPAGCEVTLVNSLERHGSRYMTSGSLKQAQATLAKMRAALTAQRVNVEKLPHDLRFLANATVLSNTADLVPYGALQSYLSGRYTAQRYSHLAKSSNESVFIRTTGTGNSDRVIVTAKYWSLGFSGSTFPSESLVDGTTTRDSPAIAGHEPNVIISEAFGQNNTLGVSTCTADDYYNDSYGEDGAIAEYGNSTLVPRIGKRLAVVFAEAGASINFTTSDVMSIGSLCAFETLDTANVTDGGRLELSVSPFCNVFEKKEWQLYGYGVDVGKYYGSGYGDPYHRGIATGYLRELLARLTSTPVVIGSPSAINTTIDAVGAATFPIPSNTSKISGPRIFFDGSHDNNVSPIAAAFGLFSSSHNLSTRADAESSQVGKDRQWRFSRIAPLQGKIVWEKIQCHAATASSHKGHRDASDKSTNRSKEFFLRVRANEAVQKAKGSQWCPSASSLTRASSRYLERGLCPLDNVIRSLEWVKSGDEWAKCFA